MYKNVVGFLLLVVTLGSLGGCGGGQQMLVLATTTSTADSGLLDDILLPFEAANDVRVEVLAVGTGQALALGERGDADLILVHDRAREDNFVAQGYGVSRYDVMYNDFVVIGPPDDPAGIGSSSNAVDAFVGIARAGEAGEAVFVSRGDSSGTHSKELQAWETAGIEPSGEWYRETGQGMGSTLTVADEMGAYTLVDRGTYLSREEGLALAILVEGDTLLFNPYGIIAVNPERH
ncbi:MAG: substrate-binding domain-containing protein, partial [Dehalococcoidia bacterium]